MSVKIQEKRFTEEEASMFYQIMQIVSKFKGSKLFLKDNSIINAEDNFNEWMFKNIGVCDIKYKDKAEKWKKEKEEAKQEVQDIIEKFKTE
jgi:hypothetical protein